MSFTDIFKKSFLEEFTGSIGLKTIVITIVIALLFSMVVYFTYKYTSKGVIYSKEFNITTSLMSVVTAAVVLSMQANMAVSLGMVGALSIVRFRTAIKEPRDLLFLFWSISNGIIIGAGVYMLAAILSFILPIGLLLLEFIPENKIPFLLVVNLDNEILDAEERIAKVLNETIHTKFKIKSKSTSKSRIDVVYEVSTKNSRELFNKLKDIEGVNSLNLISQDGEAQF